MWGRGQSVEGGQAKYLIVCICVLGFNWGCSCVCLGFLVGASVMSESESAFTTPSLQREGSVKQCYFA